MPARAVEEIDLSKVAKLFSHSLELSRCEARIRFLPGYRRARIKLDRRSLSTYLKRFRSKAANWLTATRFNEVRL